MVSASGTVQAILFAIFAAITGAVTSVAGPTYDNLLVPSLAPASIYAPLTGGGGATGGLFAAGTTMSNDLLVNIVDPLAILVFMGVGILYLVRAVIPSRAGKLADLAPRLVVGILLANAVLPVVGLLWDVAGAIYPVVYSYQGGEWQTFTNLVPNSAISFSWDNGVLSFIASLAILVLVLLLTFLVAFRDALIAVLLVLLPPLTLLWPLPPFSGLAKRAWRLFFEMAILPSALVVPLALAVGLPSLLLVLALFAVAVGMPQLISIVGNSLHGLGFPNAGSVVSQGLMGGVRSASGVATTAGRQGAAGLASALPKGVTGAVGGSLGPASVAGGLAWGAGKGLGTLGTKLAQRAGGRTASPRAAGSALRTVSAHAEGRHRAPASLPAHRRILRASGGE